MENPKYRSVDNSGDLQDWLFENVKTDFNFWPDEWIQSYKWEMRGKPEMTRITGKRNFVTFL